MRVTLNGEEQELAEGITIQDLITQLELTKRRLAVEVNRDIVNRESFAEHRLCDGDVVEIVHFIGGG